MPDDPRTETPAPLLDVIAHTQTSPRSGRARRRQTPPPRVLDCMELENRLLFSAAPLAVVARTC